MVVVAKFSEDLEVEEQLVRPLQQGHSAEVVATAAKPPPGDVDADAATSAEEGAALTAEASLTVKYINKHGPECLLPCDARDGEERLARLAACGFQIEDPQEQGGGFVASLDVQDFSPQDLAVKVSGDKLVVAGRREVKSGEVSSGSYSHSCQEFHRETQLPRNVDPQSVSCCLTEDGKLKFKAQRRALPAAAERVVVIEQPATATPGTASQSTGTTHA
uniref:Heat shock protein 30-like n=1 Tax=Petromyzon marinus TaxID=7757 RepID=A0AAJ7SK68_PETMA|nr:heat shock protein 30-like [Petromyzon marinus]